jgi:hypothetical protein
MWQNGYDKHRSTIPFFEMFVGWLQQWKSSTVSTQSGYQITLYSQFDCQPGTTTSSNNISTSHSSDDFSHYLGGHSHILTIVTNTYAKEPVAVTVMPLLEHTLHALLADYIAPTVIMPSIHCPQVPL